MRGERSWALLVVAIVTAGTVLRAWHLATPSIWWDELVHIRFAEQPSLWDVLRTVRHGIPVGSGNAGAMPLDYAFLHAYLRLVPRPGPEWLEVYYRLPSFLASSLTLLVLACWTRRAFGIAVSLAATALLATSLPHVLYAAEARFYSLFGLGVVLNLATFAALVERPDARRAWVTFGVVAVGLFLTGLLGLLVVAAQGVTLAVLALMHGGHDARRRLLRVGAVTALVAVVVLGYYADTNLTTVSVRGQTAWPLWPSLKGSLVFLGMGSTWMPVLLGLAPLPALVHVWRRHRARLPLVLCMVAIVAAALPILLAVVRWKQHVYHPRHVLFLLPLLVVLAALGLAGLVDLTLPRRVGHRREAAVAGIALALVLALVLPGVQAYARAPNLFFRHSKTLRDLRGVTLELRRRTAGYPADGRFLLITNLGKDARLGNPVLLTYLRWYGIDDRVTLRATRRPASTLAAMRTMCWSSCWLHENAVQFFLRLENALPITPGKRLLLGMPPDFRPPGRPLHLGLLLYGPLPRFRLGSTRGYRLLPLPGVALLTLDRPPRADLGSAGPGHDG